MENFADMDPRTNSQFELCISVSAKTIESLASKVKIARKYSPELLELRLDYIKDLTMEKVRSIQKLLSSREILTIRARREGGRGSFSEAERIRLVKSLFALRPKFVDVEVSTLMKAPEIISLAERSQKTKLVASFHDMKGTARREKLEDILSSIPVSRAIFAAKMVSKANRSQDNQKMLGLYSSLRTPFRIISFCFGEKGQKSRIDCLFAGSPWSYCSLPGEPLAPGQLDIESMRDAIKRSRSKRLN